MYAVVGQVKVDATREDEARRELDKFVVPSAKSLAGFTGGYWARDLDEDTGYSLMLFDAEANARAAAKQMADGPPPDSPVTFTSVSVCEILQQV